MPAEAAAHRDPDPDALDIAPDRGAEVPIGVQLAWALRARIARGELKPGRRLPPLHRLAERAGVNANTVRAVYRRLEQDGLVETRHGSGTYVTAADHRTLAGLVADAANAARAAGIDPREVAAALYAEGADAAAADAEAARRAVLRAELATLERALSGLLARRPDLAASAGQAPPPTGADDAAAARPRRSAAEPRLLTLAELEQQRAVLLDRLLSVQTAAAGPSS